MALPQTAPYVTAQYYGDSGGVTQYWYWVQAVNAWGPGPLSSNIAMVTVLSLSHSNVVSINWTPPGPGPLYYNIWRTTSATAPTTGVGQCICQGYPTVDGFVDNGIVPFTIAVASPAMLPEGAAKSAEADAKKAEQEAKAASEKEKHEQDEMLKELEETQKKADEQAAKDAERAKKLNELYMERYQPTVRETEAQKAAKKAAVAELPEKGEDGKSRPPQLDHPPSGVSATKTTTTTHVEKK